MPPLQQSLVGSDEWDGSIRWASDEIDVTFARLLHSSLQQLFDPHSDWRLRRDVYFWLFMYKQLGLGTGWVYSFDTICKVLGVREYILREQILDLLYRTGVFTLIAERRNSVSSKARRLAITLPAGQLELSCFSGDQGGEARALAQPDERKLTLLPTGFSRKRRQIDLPH
jgi:hypothetical protein